MQNTRRLALPAAGTKPHLKRGSVFFIGTATVLLRYAGFTILTDPNFLHRHGEVHIGYGLRSTRLTDPAIDLEDLPPIDLVVLSHFHEDHFDRLVQQKLDRALPIVTTRQAARALAREGFTSLYALDTWQDLAVTKGSAELAITALPAKHAPGVLSKLLPPVNGSMLQFKAGTGRTLMSLYISGDTLLHDRLREIPRRYPAIDLALLHLGGTRVLGVMVTMDAAQGVEALRIVNPRRAIPIHYNDYTVFKSPLIDFQHAVAAAGLSDRVRYLSHGDTYTFEVPASRR